MLWPTDHLPVNTEIYEDFATLSSKKKKLDGVMILYDRMGNGVEADDCGVLPGIAPKKWTEQNHKTLCTAGLLVLPSMKRFNQHTTLHW
jgi:hypothetical protein